MAKEFYTNGTGSSQTLNPSDESKIRIYDSKADADLDLANIEENEIIATKAGESEGVVEVVDTVEEDNPNAVSSGAVYDYTIGVKYTTRTASFSWEGGSVTPYVPYQSTILDLSDIDGTILSVIPIRKTGNYNDRCHPSNVIGLSDNKKYYVGVVEPGAYVNSYGPVTITYAVLYQEE